MLYCPQGEYDWNVSHAAVPFADRMEGERYRIYFTGRDLTNRSQIGFLELDLQEPSRIQCLTPEPVVRVGRPGTFDDSGAMMSWLVDYREEKYLYYVGWNLGVTVPFRNSTGLAISRDGGRSFVKFSEGPLLDRDSCDPCGATNPCVLVEGRIWRMWYLSCMEWKLEGGRPRHYYHIKYAESRDGVQWKKTGIVCIDFQSSQEYAIARPCVLKDRGLYKMWYSHRGESYRIGYAESKDGLHWIRKDEEAGMESSASGWDSEMVAYAHVFDPPGVRAMVYNGNGYGKTGFGLALLQKEPVLDRGDRRRFLARSV
jgi:hypothetical protein